MDNVKVTYKISEKISDEISQKISKKVDEMYGKDFLIQMRKHKCCISGSFILSVIDGFDAGDIDIYGIVDESTQVINTTDFSTPLKMHSFETWLLSQGFQCDLRNPRSKKTSTDRTPVNMTNGTPVNTTDESSVNTTDGTPVNTTDYYHECNDDTSVVPIDGTSVNTTDYYKECNDGTSVGKPDYYKECNDGTSIAQTDYYKECNDGTSVGKTDYYKECNDGTSVGKTDYYKECNDGTSVEKPASYKECNNNHGGRYNRRAVPGAYHNGMDPFCFIHDYTKNDSMKVNFIALKYPDSKNLLSLEGRISHMDIILNYIHHYYDFNVCMNIFDGEKLTLSYYDNIFQKNICIMNRDRVLTSLQCYEITFPIQSELVINKTDIPSIIKNILELLDPHSTISTTDENDTSFEIRKIPIKKIFELLNMKTPYTVLDNNIYFQIHKQILLIKNVRLRDFVRLDKYISRGYTIQ